MKPEKVWPVLSPGLPSFESLAGSVVLNTYLVLNIFVEKKCISELKNL